MKKTTITLILLVMFSIANSQTSRSVNEAHGLPVGANAPLFTAMDADSNYFNLEKALKQKPVVLIFYRGFWCPVCNKHLGSIQDSLSMIEASGAKVIAVSPEKPDYLNKMAKKKPARSSPCFTTKVILLPMPMTLPLSLLQQSFLPTMSCWVPNSKKHILTRHSSYPFRPPLLSTKKEKSIGASLTPIIKNAPP